MNHVILKVITIIVLFCLTLFAGILPHKIGHGGRGRQLVLSFCNCFAGGVFFATSLLDLLPMVREKFKAAFAEAKVHTVFPVAEFTTCIGFFLVLVLEQIIHSCHENAGLLHGHNHDDAEAKAPLLDSMSNGYGEAESVKISASGSTDTFATGNAVYAGRSAGGRRGTTSEGMDESSGGLRTYILVFALSLHSIFEGLALGLIVEVDRLVQITAAVIIHKSIIAFAMGISLVQHHMSFSTIVKATIIFSCMGPIGIGIGIAVLKSSSQLSSNLSSGILQGIANGTFIFVTFFEILQNELSRKGQKLVKVLFMILGFSIVTGLLYYANVVEHALHSLHPHQNVTSSIGLMGL